MRYGCWGAKSGLLLSEGTAGATALPTGDAFFEVVKYFGEAYREGAAKAREERLRVMIDSANNMMDPISGETISNNYKAHVELLKKDVALDGQKDATGIQTIEEKHAVIERL